MLASRCSNHTLSLCLSPVVEGSDPAAAQVVLAGIPAALVERHLAKVPRLTVEVQVAAINAVLLRRERVECVADGSHVAQEVMTHDVKTEPIHLHMSRKQQVNLPDVTKSLPHAVHSLQLEDSGPRACCQMHLFTAQRCDLLPD